MKIGKLEILLIEDNPSEADLIREMLSEAGQLEFSLHHVQFLSEGLSLLQSRRFDIVLVDLGLPDSQGLETALTVRRQAKLTPVIALTSLNDEEAALKSLHMGIQDYLVKGEITAPLLLRAIRYAIQRKSDSDALRESEDRFTSFMLHLPVAAWMKDLQGRYEYVNAEAERIFSTPMLAMQGKTDKEVFPPETARQFSENDERVLSEGAPLRTSEFLRQADGIEHHSMVSKFAVPGPDGEPRYVAGVALDITELKRVEVALRKSENKFSKIFQSVPAIVGITTLEGRCIDVNERGLQTLGYQREEIIGKTTLELGIWENKSERDQMIRILQEKGMVRDFETNFRGKNGKTFIGLFSAELIDFNGDRYLLSIINDITDRKRMEQEITNLNNDLETANKELEEFNYTVAHDLRQPLSLLSTCCQAIQMLCADALREECAGYVQKAHKAVLRMNGIIEALLNYSRIGHVELRPELCDLSLLAHEVAMELKQTDPERQVDFSIAKGIPVKADAHLLRLVLDNLIGNAWKYTSGREKAVIEIGVTDIGGVPAYFVRDNGSGFDRSCADKLFAPFQRLPGAEEHKGFGIGLATVAGIIRRHGGKVWAEGEPNKGATIYFTLPEDGGIHHENPDS